MKILHVIPSLGIGGTEKILYELCRGLDRQRFQCSAVALKGGGHAEARLREIPVSVSLLDSPDCFLAGTLFLPITYSKLKAAIRLAAPDIVHTWLTRANFLGRLAARGAGIRKVVSSLRVMEVEKNYHLWAERRTAKLADVITVNSSALRDFAAEVIGLPEDKVRLIRNGIDVSRSLDKKTADDYRKQWAVPGKFLIGAVGRLHQQKGFDILLEAARPLLKAQPKVHFLIAGDGPEKNNLQSQARKLGIEKSVTFCGWIAHSPEFISILDLFVLSSRWEGMPNAVMEAMLLEKPVIAAKVSGIPDLMADEAEGMIVPPENVESLAAAMNRLVNDGEFRKVLGRAAKKRILERFDLKNMIAEYETLYQSLQN